jgi:hypothetical protein
MRREHDSTQLRRYVLGALTEDDGARIEEDYFERADVLDRLCAAEDDLIDDYLSDRLASKERERFERHYLATPRHRTRVAVARALRTASAVSTPASSERHAPRWGTSIRSWPSLGQAALVAALLLLIAGGAWMFGRSSDTPVSVTTSRPSVPPASPPERPKPGEPAVPAPRDAPTAAPATPVVLAVSLSPIHVRGADEPARLTIAKGTNVVRLHLHGEAGDRPLVRGLAIVRTVAGQEIWRGPALRRADSQPPALASIDVPAIRLEPDDYIVELLESDANRRDVERHRYFFRVRAEQPRNLP